MTPEGYTQLTRELMSLAGGKVVLALEGGYSLAATAVSAAGCMTALLGIAPPPPEQASKSRGRGRGRGRGRARPPSRFALMAAQN